MGLSAKLWHLSATIWQHQTAASLSGALGQGGNSQAGRAGARALLPTTISVWFSPCLSQCQGLAPLGTEQSTHQQQQQRYCYFCFLLPIATASMLSTSHALTHTSTSHALTHASISHAPSTGSKQTLGGRFFHFGR